MRLPKYDAPVLIFYLPFEVCRIISDYPFPSCQPDRVASVRRLSGAIHNFSHLHYMSSFCAPEGTLGGLSSAGLVGADFWPSLALPEQSETAGLRQQEDGGEHEQGDDYQVDRRCRVAARGRH
jgi:hypothetical protein